MKVLLINDLGAPHGGAERLTLSLRAGLRERGHDARLFASSAPSASGPNQADYQCFGTTSAVRTLNRVVNLSAPARLRRVLREFAPDVVHVRMFLSQLSPLILPLLRDFPTLYHATWYEMICPLGLKLLPDGSICRNRAGKICRATGCLSRRAYLPLMLQLNLVERWRSVFDMIVTNSDYVRLQLHEHGIGPAEVLWNGVPTVSARPALASPPTVTSAGRLGHEKGIDVLIRSFAGVVRSMPEARLLIAGDGPMRDSLVRLIAELGLQDCVSMLGHLRQDEMERELAVGWVHAVPTICAETFGVTAAESMMRGTAVIGSSEGGLKEIIVPEETGLLVAPGDVGAWTAALLRVLGDRDLAERWGQSARQRALQFMSHADWIDRFLAYYSTMLDARRTL